MRKITAALLALILTLSLAACGMFEQTETIYVKSYSERIIAGQTIRMEYEYSTSGTPISVKTYFNGNLYQSASTRISGSTTYQTIVDKDGNENNQTTTVTKDDRGNVTVMEVSVSTTPVSRTYYTYDDQDRVTNTNTLTTLGTTDVTYVYDAAGNIAEQIVDDETEDLYTRTLYTYDDRGFVLEEKVYDEDGAPVGSIRYTYAEDGSRRVAEYFDAEGNATGEKLESEYDEHGNLVKEITYLNEDVLQTVVHVYVPMEIPVNE